jgi:predicted nucleic acid-binding protein
MSADFIDSNVFVYLFDETDARKQAIASQCVTRALEHGSGVISFQVVQESLNVLTRKIKVPLKPDDAESFLRQVLQPLWHVQPSAALYTRALKLQTGLSISFYDSLMVAGALEAGCKRLLTEDLQHGQRIEGLRIDNPFIVR